MAQHANVQLFIISGRQQYYVYFVYARQSWMTNADFCLLEKLFIVNMFCIKLPKCILHYAFIVWYCTTAWQMDQFDHIMSYLCNFN